MSINGRNFSTDSNKIDEPFKVEEAGTVNVPPPQPPTEKVFYNCAVIWNLLLVSVYIYAFTNIEIMYVYLLGVFEVACVGRQWFCWISCL